MGRTKKLKKVWTIDEIHKGDDRHDDAPKIDWEASLEAENRKFTAKLRKDQSRITAKAKRKEVVKAKTNNTGLQNLKIGAQETLREFSSRIDIEARLREAEKALRERNQRRKAKREEKLKLKEENRFEDGDEREEPKQRFRGPRTLNTAEQPPELGNISNNKRRFIEMASNAQSSKEDQMASLLKRAQGMYKKRKT